MIAEIIFALIMGALLGYIIYKFKSIFEKRKLHKNIGKKIEKQDKIFFQDGKKVEIFDDKITKILSEVKKDKKKTKTKK